VRTVTDASVLIQIALAGGQLGPLASSELVAPPLALSEATSAIGEMAWRGELPRERVPEILGHLQAIDVTIIRPDELPQRAWEIASSLGWAKTYDAEYVALARLLGLPLATLDVRLRRGAGHLVAFANLGA
jgi:predicted nucleic acid-binding protein